MFPEDVPVPASFFSRLAPYLSGEKASRARLSVGKCLSTLSKYSLLKGSISREGVFMHDIVRDYAIRQHTESGLISMQKAVVDEILAARPDAGGFRHTASTGTFEGYVVRHLYWHFRGALAEGEEPPDA